MARHLQISFLLLAIYCTFFLAGNSTGISPTHPPAAGNPCIFLYEACNVTLYPDLCFSSLHPYTHTFKRTPRKLAIVAIYVSHAAARNASVFLAEMRETSSNGERAALTDCVSVLSDGMGLMEDSMRELQHFKKHSRQFQLGNVKTWMSAALTNENTCTDGFEDLGGKVKEVVDEKIDRVAKLTSNALALVNWFADSFELIAAVGTPEK